MKIVKSNYSWKLHHFPPMTNRPKKKKKPQRHYIRHEQYNTINQLDLIDLQNIPSNNSRIHSFFNCT